MLFRRAGAPNVYVADGLASPGGWAGLVLPASVSAPDTIALAEALGNDALYASIVMATRAPDLTDKGAALSARVKSALGSNPRGFVWLGTGGGTPVLPFGAPTGLASAATSGLLSVPSLTARTGLSVAINAYVAIAPTADGSGVTFTRTKDSSGWALQITQPNVAQLQAIGKATLALTGAAAGQFSFSVALKRGDIAQKLNCGFQMLVQGTTAANPVLPAWFPFYDGTKPAPTDWIGFAVTLDYSDPTNAVLPARTAFWFDGSCIDRNGNPIPLAFASYYRTQIGQALRLFPATAANLPAGGQAAYFELREGLGFDVGSELFQLAPVGDFWLQLDGAGPSRCRLLCGLGGTEAIELLAGGQGVGDRLRFVSADRRGQGTTGGAYVPVWPLPAATPLNAPMAADEAPLSGTFQTNWATIVAADSAAPPLYCSQPAKAPLFVAGQPSDGPALLSPFQPGRPWPAQPNLAVPLLPYAGVAPGTGPSAPTQIDPATLAAIEGSVISPYRRRLISAASDALAPSATPGPPATQSTTPSATPAGIIVQARDDGSYSDILLVQTQAAAGQKKVMLGFGNPADELQEAFQGHSLFLVVANADNLGTVVDYAKQVAGNFPGGGATFPNAVTVGDWVMEANIGGNPAYGDYRSVMIVKARPGRLVDLVAATDAWTAPATFAAPSILQHGTPGPPDPAQIANVSQWLTSYVNDAVNSTDDAFADFANLAQLDSWTGILVLAASVAAFPEDLAGMAAGIDQSRFLAHHFGTRLSPVDGSSVSIAGTSSVFGLINYTDPAYSTSMGEAPVPVASNDDYSFLVLKLQALFQNSAVKRFSSLAQLVVSRLFGIPVAGMVADNGNNYNAVLFDGAYQNSGGVSTYSLSTRATFGFELASAVLSRVAITAASLNTVSAGVDASGHREGVSVFALSGLMDFAALQQTNSPNGFDLLSFGAGDPSDPVTGLSFSRLGLPMTYQEGPTPTREISFDASAISFDAARSAIRVGSLYKDLALTIDSMTSADAGGIDALGYEQMLLAGIEAGGPGSGGWYGLAFKVDFGTPGRLGAAVGLTARMLLAWGPGGDAAGTPDLAAGLWLPGMSATSPLSLQSVLKLSVGRIILSRGGASEEEARFLLTLNDIALKALGLLKLPPNGVTNFLLFGAPESAGDSSSLGWLAIYNQNPPPPPAPPAPRIEGGGR